MASSGFVAASSAIPDFPGDLLPIFHVEPVQLQFQVASGFVAVQVANNVIILALAYGRLLRIDLASPQDVDGMSGLSAIFPQLILLQTLIFPARFPRSGPSVVSS